VNPVRSFISYSRADADIVLRLCQDLRAAGISIWLDKLDIRPGEDWDESIARGMAECGRMVIVLSPTSVASDNVLDEVGYALSKKKQIIPILLQDCEVPYRLSRMQYIDFRNSYDDGFKLLAQTMQGSMVGPDNRETAPNVKLRAFYVLAGVAAVVAIALFWSFQPRELPFKESYREALQRYIAEAPSGFQKLGAKEFVDWNPSVNLPSASSCRGSGYPREPVITCVMYRTRSEVEAANKFEDLIELTQAVLPGWKGGRMNMFVASVSNDGAAARVLFNVIQSSGDYDVVVAVRPK
jgi:hypothetical protein